MKDTRLLNILNETKDTLCRYDYYIHIPKKILHLTNTEIKLPHLMGLQYIGRPNQYAGDYGVYSIKKERLPWNRWKSLQGNIIRQRRNRIGY